MSQNQIGPFFKKKKKSNSRPTLCSKRVKVVIVNEYKTIKEKAKQGK